MAQSMNLSFDEKNWVLWSIINGEEYTLNLIADMKERLHEALPLATLLSLVLGITFVHVL